MVAVELFFPALCLFAPPPLNIFFSGAWVRWWGSHLLRKACSPWEVCQGIFLFHSHGEWIVSLRLRGLKHLQTKRTFPYSDFSVFPSPSSSLPSPLVVSVHLYFLVRGPLFWPVDAIGPAKSANCVCVEPIGTWRAAAPRSLAALDIPDRPTPSTPKILLSSHLQRHHRVRRSPRPSIGFLSAGLC